MVLDFFIVNVAISSMARSLQAGSGAIEWVVAGYGLAYAAGLITGGRLGDLYGPRRMFALGLALFILASLACGVAPNSAAIAPRHAGATAGMLTAMQQVGAALGVAIIGIIFYGQFGHAGQPEGYAHAFTASLIYLSALAASVALLIQLLPRDRATGEAGQSPASDSVS